MDINVVRARLAGTAGALEILQDTQGAADLRALLADHARMREVSQEMVKALSGLTLFVATEALESCNGSKCREPWCAGCFGEECAEQAANEARSALDAARVAITKAVQP